MINLAIIASVVVPTVLVFVVDRVSLRLTARQRRDATAVAAERQAQSLAAMPTTQGPRVIAPDLATGDARNVA